MSKETKLQELKRLAIAVSAENHRCVNFGYCRACEFEQAFKSKMKPETILKMVAVAEAAKDRFEVWTPQTYHKLKNALEELEQ